VNANLVSTAGFQPTFDEGRLVKKLQRVTARLPRLTMAIFLRFTGERASGASMVPAAVFGTPLTIAK
jgi:hypothetical protein